jgi:hypothetical protein
MASAVSCVQTYYLVAALMTSAGVGNLMRTSAGTMSKQPHLLGWGKSNTQSSQISLAFLVPQLHSLCYPHDRLLSCCFCWTVKQVSLRSRLWYATHIEHISDLWGTVRC